jgi:hypothetical protein
LDNFVVAYGEYASSDSGAEKRVGDAGSLELIFAVR